MTLLEVSDSGIILRTFESGESNLICRVLTKGHGKLSALARGARKSKKRFPGGLECFDQGIIRFKSGGADLEILLDFNPSQSRVQIRSDLQRICCASLAVEIFDNLIRGDEHQGAEYFETLSQYLHSLNQKSVISGSASTKSLLRELFELISEALVISGYLEPGRIPPSAKGLARLLETIEFYTEKELKAKSAIESIIRDI